MALQGLSKCVFMVLKIQRANTSLWLCKVRGEQVFMALQRKMENTFLWLCKDRGETHLFKEIWETRFYCSAKTEGKTRFYGSAQAEGKHILMFL